MKNYPHPGVTFLNPAWQNTKFIPVEDEAQSGRYWIIAESPMGTQSRIIFTRDLELCNLVLDALRLTQAAYKRNLEQKNYRDTGQPTT